MQIVTANTVEAERSPGVHRAGPPLHRVRRRREPDRHLQGGEPRAVQDRPGAQGRHRRRAGGRGRELLHPQGHQPEEPGAGHAGERLGRRGDPGRVHDHPAAGEEPSPHQRSRHRPQDPRSGLRVAGGAEVLQGRDPGALPQHRLPRKQRLRPAGGGRDVLRQERGPARHLGRRLPGRAHPQPLRLRPAGPSRAGSGPLPAGRRPPGRRRQGDGRAGQSSGGELAAADQAAVDTANGRAPLVLHRGGAQAAPERDDDPG